MHKIQNNNMTFEQWITTEHQSGSFFVVRELDKMYALCAWYEVNYWYVNKHEWIAARSSEKIANVVL